MPLAQCVAPKGDEDMNVEFNNKIVDSNEFKNIIEKNTEFKVIKDMSKGSKREDILAFNLSVGINILNDLMEEECNVCELTEDELFEEYLSLAEEIAMDIEEYVPEGAIMDIKSYEWDKSVNAIKLVIIIASEDIYEVKLRDVMKRLVTQVE
ncbi:MAG: hypothetical protein ACJAX4_003643 [Clostridium sp.]|jgi:hypothetical protein